MLPLGPKQLGFEGSLCFLHTDDTFAQIGGWLGPLVEFG